MDRKKSLVFAPRTKDLLRERVSIQSHFHDANDETMQLVAHFFTNFWSIG
jgi:hypothetical protein